MKKKIYNRLKDDYETFSVIYATEGTNVWEVYIEGLDLLKAIDLCEKLNKAENA